MRCANLIKFVFNRRAKRNPENQFFLQRCTYFSCAISFRRLSLRSLAIRINRIRMAARHKQNSVRRQKAAKNKQINNHWRISESQFEKRLQFRFELISYTTKLKLNEIYSRTNERNIV